MGLNNSNLKQQGIQSHNRLGLVKLLQKQPSLNIQQNSSFIQLKRQISNEFIYQKWVKQIQKIDNEQSRDLIYLPVSFRYQQAGICSSGGHAILTYQNFPYILKTEIKNRKQLIHYFQQTELWYLMYNLVETATIFQQKNMKIGDMNPNNCVLNQNGQMKIIATCSLPGQTTNYQKIIQSSLNDVYLAPEEIDRIFIQKDLNCNIDIKSAQTFSIGITMLQAASLQDCYSIYDRQPYKLNMNRLNELIKIVQSRYGFQLCKYIKGMVHQQPKKRIKCNSIFSDLYPYEQSILQLRQFSLLFNQNSAINNPKNIKTIYQNNKNDSLILGMDSISTPINNIAINVISPPINNIQINSISSPINNLQIKSYDNSYGNLALNSIGNYSFDKLAIDSALSPHSNLKNPENDLQNSNIRQNKKKSKSDTQQNFNEFYQNHNLEDQNDIQINQNKSLQKVSSSSSIKIQYVRQFM